MGKIGNYLYSKNSKWSNLINAVLIIFLVFYFNEIGIYAVIGMYAIDFLFYLTKGDDFDPDQKLQEAAEAGFED